MSSDPNASVVVVAVDHGDGNGGSSSMPTTIWAIFSTTQLLGAAALHKRGDGGPTSMPIRAFAIASLLLGGGACAIGGALHASGIREHWELYVCEKKVMHFPLLIASMYYVYQICWKMVQVKDLVNIGRTIRCALGKPPRKQS